jgi:hypothetical protein
MIRLSALKSCDEPHIRREPAVPPVPPAAKAGWLRHGNPVGDLAAIRRCGARTRAGGACRQPAMANGRCRLHGGKSTGPRTAAGLANSCGARLVHGRRAAWIGEIKRAGRVWIRWFDDRRAGRQGRHCQPGSADGCKISINPMSGERGAVSGSRTENGKTLPHQCRDQGHNEKPKGRSHAPHSSVVAPAKRYLPREPGPIAPPARWTPDLAALARGDNREWLDTQRRSPLSARPDGSRDLLFSASPRLRAVNSSRALGLDPWTRVGKT